MRTSTPTASPTTRARSATVVRVVGAVGAIAGLAGAAHAALLVAWPADVAEDSYSYPLDAGTFAASQTVLAARDLALTALLYALCQAPVSRTRLARLGFAISAAAMLALTGLEVMSVVVGDAADLGAWYGFASFGVGIGLVVAGASATRSSLESRWLHRLPLTIGLYVFAVLTPGILAGFVPGQLALGGWMLLFAQLGWAARTHAGAERAPSGPGSGAAP